jgi:replicative DNA helicase
MVDPRNIERVPPNDVEAEAAMLGAMLLDKYVVSEVGDLVTGDDFYMPQHRFVFEAIMELDRRAAAIDVITVKNQLKKTGTFEDAGGAETLVRLQEAVPSAASAKYHAKIVRDTSRLRRLIHASHENLERCYDPRGEIDEVLDAAEQAVFEIRRNEAAEAVTVKDILRQTIVDIESRQSQSGQLRGLDTGFADLNDATNGLQGGNLVIVAARPSMGKTTFAMNIATQAALRTGKTSVIFSLEVPRELIVENLLCSVARIDAHKMRKGSITPDEWQRVLAAANELSNTSILVDDTPGLTAGALRAKARRLADSCDLGLVVVDYLQLMQAPQAENRQQEIAQISLSLKTTARQLKIPVMALSQLNRAVDARDDHVPRMSDLRESGSIEQDADLIMFLYREAYYNPEIAEERRRDSEVIIAKHRNGPTGRVKLLFMNEYLRFVDPARHWQAPGR